MLQLLVPYHDLLYHSFKITHFRTTLLVPIHNHISVPIIHNLISNIQPSSTHFQTHIPTTITQTLQPVQTIPIQPQINVLNPFTSSNPSTTHTIPPTTIPLSTLNTPTYINSATSISEPITPFDGLDHNYTPEEYLQHFEARVTFR